MNEMTTGLTLRLSAVDITYLARMLGAELIFGIGDPFYGWLAEDVIDEWTKASDSLMDRGIIRNTNAGLAVDAFVSIAVSTFAWPKATFIFNELCTDSDVNLFIVHVGAQFAVKHPVFKEIHELLDINVYMNSDALIEELVTFVCSGGGNESRDFSTTSMPMQSMWRLLTTKNEELEASITKLDMPDDFQSELEITLQSDFVYRSITRIRLVSDAWELDGLGFIMDDHSTWLVKPDLQHDELKVVISSCSKSRSEDLVKSIISTKSLEPR